jgi:thiamine biosynthesis protein ThiS
MFVLVNGQAYPLPESGTLAAVLRSLAPPAPFAVALNEEFIPGTYEDCLVHPNDRIDIVHPTAGG